MTTFKEKTVDQLLRINIFDLDINQREKAYRAIRDISQEEYKKISPRKINQRQNNIAKRREYGHDLKAEKAEKELEEDNKRYFGEDGLQNTKWALAILNGVYDDSLDECNSSAEVVIKALKVRKSEL